MSKSKKRFETSQSICRRIDAEKQRAYEIRLEADAKQQRYKLLLPSEHPDEIAERDFCRMEANKLFKSAERIETVVLPKLSAKLAEFNTNLLPGVTDDSSVPVR